VVGVKVGSGTAVGSTTTVVGVGGMTSTGGASVTTGATVVAWAQAESSMTALMKTARMVYRNLFFISTSPFLRFVRIESGLVRKKGMKLMVTPPFPYR
jgi:hypothetical protein